MLLTGHLSDIAANIILL